MSLSGLQKIIPITMKLNPFNRANLLYLAEIAALTRMVTGFVRVDQNRPSKLKDPKLSENEKRLACIERFFVEIVGTIGYMIALHLGQDLTSKIFEKRDALRTPQLTEAIARNLNQDEIKLANQALHQVYGVERQGLVHRVLYQGARLSALREKLGDSLFEKMRPYVDDFARRANVAASISVLGGVALSALFGGLVTQWLNDRVASPLARKFLVKKFGDTPKPVEETARTLPATPVAAPVPANPPTTYARPYIPPPAFQTMAGLPPGYPLYGYPYSQPAAYSLPMRGGGQ